MWEKIYDDIFNFSKIVIFAMSGLVYFLVIQTWFDWALENFKDKTGYWVIVSDSIFAVMAIGYFHYAIITYCQNVIITKKEINTEFSKTND